MYQGNEQVVLVDLCNDKVWGLFTTKELKPKNIVTPQYLERVDDRNSFLCHTGTSGRHVSFPRVSYNSCITYTSPLPGEVEVRGCQSNEFKRRKSTQPSSIKGRRGKDPETWVVTSLRYIILNLTTLLWATDSVTIRFSQRHGVLSTRKGILYTETFTP